MGALLRAMLNAKSVIYMDMIGAGVSIDDISLSTVVVLIVLFAFGLSWYVFDCGIAGTLVLGWLLFL